MTYRLGIDVDPARTTWAVIAGTPERAPDAGAIDSVVTIVLRDDVIMAREFVEKLGQPEPIIIGGTPYGVEALLAKLVAGVVGSATQRQGEGPAAVVLVHPDELDPYRTGLYAEALRLAGVPKGQAFVVSRSEARAAHADPDTAVGGAAVGWQRVPTPVDDDTHLGGAVVLGSGAAGAVALASMAGDGLDAGIGLSSAAGPEGIGLAHAGPSGASIGTSGPAGTSLPGAGATTGAPLSGPPAPPGTPMAAPGGAPAPQAGPPAPADTPTTATPTTATTTTATTTPATGSTPPPPPPPPPGGPGGRLPELTVRPGLLEVAPGPVWWRRGWFFPIVFVLVLAVAVPVVFLMGRSDSARSVAPASSVARVVVTTTTTRPVASVLAPATSVATTSATTTTSTTTTTTTAPTTTPPPTTTPRTTTPRTTVRATVPPTVPATVPATLPPTTIAPTTTPIAVNSPPTITALTSSQGTLPTCATSSTTLTVNVADDGGVMSVVVSYSYLIDKATTTSGSVNLSGASSGGVWSGVFTMTSPTTYGLTAVNLTATVMDSQGSSASIGPTQQVLKAAAPPIC